MSNGFLKNIKAKVPNILVKDKEKIPAKDLVVCQFYQDEEKKIRILKRLVVKGLRDNFRKKTGREIQTYKDIETEEEIQKITGYSGGMDMSTKFVGPNLINYIRI